MYSVSLSCQLVFVKSHVVVCRVMPSRRVRRVANVDAQDEGSASAPIRARG